MEKFIITINRECGTGGGEIARNYHVCANITGLDSNTETDFLAEQIRCKMGTV